MQAIDRRGLPDPRDDQKAFLAAAKDVLRPPGGRLTWDTFAGIIGVESRALKTYRMPADSSDYRSMPKLLIEKVEGLLLATRLLDVSSPDRTEPTNNDITWTSRTEVLKLLPKALAALVTRQAKQVFMGGGASMVSGVDRLYSGTSGLGDEDRRAMALVSRARLSLSMPDVGAEIHELLTHCTKPFEEWLPIDVIKDEGLSKVRLIDPDDREPTLEAEELAAGFGGMTSLLEEQVFAALRDALSKQPQRLANDYYTAVRTFVVRNPVVTRTQLLKQLGSEKLPLPMSVFACLEQFYEPLPRALSRGETVRLCGHCRNLMQPHVGGLRCTTQACVAVHGPNPGSTLGAEDLLRLNRSLRKYWLEPGIDEVRLADLLSAAGHTVRLYPNGTYLSCQPSHVVRKLLIAKGIGGWPRDR